LIVWLTYVVARRIGMSASYPIHEFMTYLYQQVCRCRTFLFTRDTRYPVLLKLTFALSRDLKQQCLSIERETRLC
jgi:hypothetical protein